jgi:hypothetical protein
MNGVDAQQALILAEQSKRSHETTPNVPANLERRRGARRLRRWLDITTLTLATLGIVFAIWQFVDSRQLRQDTKSILNYATTRYVAEFPDNLKEITKLVGGTCGSLKILVDVPGYGMYSSFSDFLDYEDALRKAARATIEENFAENHCIGKSRPQGGRLANVRLLLWNPLDQDTQSIRKQFREIPEAPPADDWRKNLLVAGSQERTKLLNFISENPDIFKGMLKDKTPGAAEAFLKKVALEEDSYEAFVKGLETAHREVEKNLHASKVEIRYAKMPVIYMRLWIQDSSDSVFSFDHTPTSGDETEIAFQSHDPYLLKTFDAMFDQHWSEGVCYGDYWDYVKGHPAAGIEEIRKLPKCTTNE